MTMRRRKAKRRRFEVQLRKAARQSTVNGALPPVTFSRSYFSAGDVYLQGVSAIGRDNFNLRGSSVTVILYTVTSPPGLFFRSGIIN